MLSTILKDGSPGVDKTPSPSQHQYAGGLPWPTDSLSPSQYSHSPVINTNGYGSSYAEQPMSAPPPDTPLSAGSGSQMSPTFTDNYPTVSQYQQLQQESGQQLQYAPQFSQQQLQNQSQPLLHGFESRYRHESRSSPASTSAFIERSSSKDSIARALGSPASSNSPASTSMQASYADNLTSHVQSIDARVTRPHDYTKGYHFLMKHLKSR